MTELLRGTYYSPEHQIVSWRESAPSEGLFGDLYRHGVQVHEYTYYGYHCYELAASCRDTVGLKAELSTRPRGFAVVDLWFLKTLPTSVRRIAFGDTSVDAADWDYGFSITELLLGDEDGPADNHNAYYSVRQFERMLDDEALRSGSGQLVFAHVLVPHPPYVLGERCEYLGEVDDDEDVYDRVFSQSICAQFLLRRLIDRLDELDRLDRSLIMAVSDHGTFWIRPHHLETYMSQVPSPYPNQDEDDSATWPSEMIEIRSSALMLIKFPFQNTWRSSAQRLQMVDVAPTVAAHFDAPTGHYDGRTIEEKGSDEDREMLFYAFNKLPVHGAPAVMSIYRRNGAGE